MNLPTVKLIILLMLVHSNHAARKLQPQIELERAVVEFVNKSFGSVYVNVAKLRNKTKALTINMTCVKDIPSNALFYIQVYKFADGQYKLTGIQLTDSVCNVLNNEYKMLFGPYMKKELRNFLQGCPIKKGVYHFENVAVPDIKFPYIPHWSVKQSYKVLSNNINILELSVYTRVIDVYV